MIEAIREFVVREEERGRFELVFGPGVAWGAPVAGLRSKWRHPPRSC